MATEITYILSIGDVPFIDADSIGSLDTAKEFAKTIMRNDYDGEPWKGFYLRREP